jgi:CBS domain-containing protein
MKARDVMVSPVITVRPDASVKEVAETLVANHISAVPVVDALGRLVGIVSEGDLVRRVEVGTERRRSWWLLHLMGEEAVASEYIKDRARKVKDIMTPHVVTAAPDTPLSDIAILLEKRTIKRVPIVHNSQVVGIVSRANLVQALAGTHEKLEVSPSDATIRSKLLEHLSVQPWAHTSRLNVTVHDGIVRLWGITNSDTERTALRVAAESISGVRAVADNLVTMRHPMGV